MGRSCFFVIVAIAISSCGSINKAYNPDQKYSKKQLEGDYTLLRKILEKKHPSLYWYTSQDSMNYFFNKGYSDIKDSMTELQFGWEVLAPLINKIHCGHTSFGMSKSWNRFMYDRKLPSFPLHLKIWKDTMVVTTNLNLKDSVIKIGTVITSINGLRTQDLVERMFNYMPQDGYSDNVNYIRISSNFPYYHRNIFGVYDHYRVEYMDSTGSERNLLLPMYNPAPDSTKKKKRQHRARTPVWK